MSTDTGTQFSEVGLNQLRQRVQHFAIERDWQQFHTPRNLLLALTGEVGELAEIFQWRGEVLPQLPGFTAAEQQHVGEELSDVLVYLVRMSDVCGIDLGQAVLAKLAKNAAKYPVDKCKGSSDKYTAYQQHEQQQQREGSSQHVTEQLQSNSSYKSQAAATGRRTGCSCLQHVLFAWSALLAALTVVLGLWCAAPPTACALVSGLQWLSPFSGTTV